MRSLLARLRAVPPRVAVGVAVAGAVVLGDVVVVLDSTDTLFGLIELAGYISAILGLSAAVTYAVIRISPTKSKSKSAESG